MSLARESESVFDAEQLLLAVAAAADQDAFTLLFEHYAPRIKAYLIRTGSTPAHAEELAQEAMFSVWRKAAQFAPERANASAWVFGIVRNLRIDAIRRDRTRSRTAAVPDPPPELENPESKLSAAQAAVGLRDALAELPPDLLQAVRAAFFDERSHSNIAVTLGVPLGTIKSRVRRGLQRLRTGLEQRQ